MAEEASTAPGLRVLAHSEADLSGFTRPAADIFVYQGRTTHFTTLYASGLLIHSPDDICLLTSDPGWRTSWSIIAPGNFSGRQFSDLLFDDPSAGLGEFYTTEGGNLSLLASDPGWRTSWSIIIPCNLTGGTYNDLLFYDPSAGVGEIYSTDGHGGMNLVATNVGWRTSWSVIAACNITGGRYDDLVFYDAAGGTGEIYTTDGHGHLAALVASHTDWRTSWSIVKPCNISGGKSSDLMFYDPSAGVGEFYSTDSGATSRCCTAQTAGGQAGRSSRPRISPEEKARTCFSMTALVEPARSIPREATRSQPRCSRPAKPTTKRYGITSADSRRPACFSISMCSRETAELATAAAAIPC